LAVLDVSRKTAFHLFGFQTIDLNDQEILIEFYTRKLLERKESLLQISKYMVADAYFSKSKFIQPFIKAGFLVVSRLRDDADLQYIFTDEQKKGRGRKRKYEGKVDLKQLNLKYAKLVSELLEDEKIYLLEVYSKSMDININIVIVYTKGSKDKWTHKFYFSTDLKQDWEEVLEFYRLRFQIEFLYRDVKQFTGLNHCEV